MIKYFVCCANSNYTIFSDDENIYPSKVITTEPKCTKKVFEERWIFVTEGDDNRPQCLPDFNEPSGPTFTLPACPSPSDYYKKMLPDSLFNHIVECTNLRAKLYFANIPTKNNTSWREVKENQFIFSIR